MKSELSFSICMPVYNGACVIGPTLRSIFSQSFTNYELIITDDCSKDGIEKVVKDFRDERVKFFKNQKNLGYSLNLEECRKKAKNEIIFLMGQDDILAQGSLLKIENIFSANEDIGAVTRAYFWFDESIKKPVRLKLPLESNKDEVLTVDSPQKDLLRMFSSLDQLSGLAYRRKFLDIGFHKDIFPCHVYPFMSILKRHPIVFLKDYTIAVRIGTSQTRKISSIYDESPVQSWVEMFKTVFFEKKFSEQRDFWIRNFVATNYVGLVQIRNYGRYRYLLREIFYLLKYRWENLFNFQFWFFSLGCIIMPPFALTHLVDWYKNRIMSQSFKQIKFNYK